MLPIYFFLPFLLSNRHSVFFSYFYVTSCPALSLLFVLQVTVASSIHNPSFLPSPVWTLLFTSHYSSRYGSFTWSTGTDLVVTRSRRPNETRMRRRGLEILKNEQYLNAAARWSGTKRRMPLVDHWPSDSLAPAEQKRRHTRGSLDFSYRLFISALIFSLSCSSMAFPCPSYTNVSRNLPFFQPAFVYYSLSA